MGRITRPHGVRGEVSVLPLSDLGARFEPGSRLFLGESDGRPFTVRASRPHHQRLLVSFDHVRDRTGAEALAGAYLFVPVSEVPLPPEGRYWPHQLIGCEVVTDNGRSLGSIGDIVWTQANDLWVAVGPDGEALIPALREVVAEVDIAGRRVVVREIPGLTAP